MDSFLQVYHYVDKNDLISTILIDFNPLIANVLTMTLVRKKFIRFNLRWLGVENADGDSKFLGRGVRVKFKFVPN